ncbi:polysaccharide deacetylase [Desulfosarcina variabilis str. Montpellier]|uniref:polysaccharide deacetylase family protein n=1 Tax=Desulfosarcina variabilis TaxID=2300 RepID=UPI003AFA3C93
MPASPFTVVQCWDDGVTTDARLTDLLRRLGIPATFNLCAGMHDNQRRFGWMHAGQEVWRLGWDEMNGVYDGFTIANHSLTHPNLCEMSAAAAQHEISVGRERLQQFFGQRVAGFAYPFGAYTPAVMALVRETGHVYARTVESKADGFPPAEPMAFHPSCHFLAPDFWQRYEDAKRCGVFYFWGHSFELVDETLWQALETTFTRISADPDSRWGNLPDLFGG